MKPETLSECEKYRVHFTDLLELGCKIIELPEKSTARILPEDDMRDFCAHCTYGERKGLTTHLYGCHEANRWNGKYIYYCPLGLTFIAASITENGIMTGGIVVGPIVMGEAQDVVYEIPAPEMAWAVSQLSSFSTNKVRHISEILGAVTEKISDAGFTPHGVEKSMKREIGKQLLTDISVAKEFYAEDGSKGAETLLEFEKELHFALLHGEKKLALQMINEELAYIHVYSDFDVRAIKARLMELLVVLSRATIEAGADPVETFRLSEDFFQQIEQYSDADQLALWISDIVRRFILLAFDLAQVKQSDVVFKTTNYIRKNCANKLSLDSLAKEVYLSKSYLSSIFKKETGVSLTDYITKVRIEKSKKLLLEKNTSLAVISGQCGFRDQSYFTKVFKKLTGVSPKHYRSNYFTASDA